MKLGKVSRGSVAALVVVMLAGAGVMWALADRPAEAADTPAEAADTPAEAADTPAEAVNEAIASQSYQYNDYRATIPALDKSYGTVVIHGIEYPLNQAGQSYGVATYARNAFIQDADAAGGIQYKYNEDGDLVPISEISDEDAIDYYPDLVLAECWDTHERGYVYKEDYMDAYEYTPFEQLTWPEHEDGVEDFKYYPVYEPDGVTQIGEIKRLNVNVTKSCILSDGSVYLITDDGEYHVDGGLAGCTDSQLREFAKAVGMDVETLMAERDKLIENQQGVSND